MFYQPKNIMKFIFAELTKGKMLKIFLKFSFTNEKSFGKIQTMSLNSIIHKKSRHYLNILSGCHSVQHGNFHKYRIFPVSSLGG